MNGKRELTEKIIEIVENVKRKYELVDAENGFDVKIEGYPYIFKISFFKEIGWNVYLELCVSQVLIEHEGTSILYEKMEDIIDLINLKYCDLSNTTREIIENGFNSLDCLVDFHNEVIKETSKDILTYKIFLKSNENLSPQMEVRYSPSINHWQLFSTDICKGSEIINEYYPIFDDLIIQVQKFNKQVKELNYYY